MRVLRLILDDRPLTTHFNASEFRCRCGCGRVAVALELAEGLQALRGLVGGPLVVRSGYRCPVHNRATGGSPRSYHTLGMAADVRTPYATPPRVEAAVRHLIALGVLGWVKSYASDDFCHIDIRDLR